MAKKKTQDEFIAECIALNGGLHLLDRVDYKNRQIKVEVGCRVDGHGYWMVSPCKYLQGSGCPKCARDKSADACRSNTEEFIAKAKKMAGADNHLFDRVDYKNNSTKVSIGCKTEGHGYWWVRPNSFLGGAACPKCTRMKTGDRCRSNTEQFIAKAKKMAAADNHLFDRVDYKGTRTHVEIGCKTEGHGYWWVKPNNYLKGSGCPKCTRHGFNPAKPGRLYYLRVDAPTEPLYKVGITNRTVAKRYNKRDMEKIDTIDELIFEVGADAYDAEQLILRHFSTMRRDHDRENLILVRGGDTELLLDDVLGVGDLQRMINACIAYDSALQLAS